MTFKEEIKNTMLSNASKVTLYSNNKPYDGYCLFQQISKTTEEYYNAKTPDKIGQVLCITYSVWCICLSKIKNIDFIIYDDKKYETIYSKYRKETGCFEMIVSEKTIIQNQNSNQNTEELKNTELE